MRIHFCEVMMKKIILFLVLLSACTSNRVKMTPAEIDEVLIDQFNIHYFSALENLGEPYRLRRHYCSTRKNSQNTEDCYLIECSGIREHRNCWRTVITGKDAQELREKVYYRKLSSEEHIEKLNSCLFQEKDWNQKRRDCFEFLQSLKFESKIDQSEAEKVFNFLCDLKGVVCAKDNQKVGKGFMNEQAHFPKERSVGSFSIEHSPSAKPTVYIYSIGKE